MTFHKALPTLAVALLALTACGTQEDTKADTSPSATATSTASASSSSGTSDASTSAKTSASASTEAGSSDAKDSAAAQPAAENNSEPAPPADSIDPAGSNANSGKVGEVQLTVQVNGTAEFSYSDNGKLQKENISEGFTRTFTVPTNGVTSYYTIDASGKDATATEVICELRYNDKVIASFTSADRPDAVKATCGVKGDINTMAEQPSKLK